MNNPAIFLFPAVRKFLCIAFLFSLVYSTSAQTTLTYGDICFIGLNAQVPPGHQGGVLQWVPLVDLAPGTVIKFTNTGWHNNSHAMYVENREVMNHTALYLLPPNSSIYFNEMTNLLSGLPQF